MCHALPLRNAVRCSSLVALLLTKSHKSKKTAIYLRRNIMKCRFWGGVLQSFYWGTPLGVIALWRFYWPNHINARRARHVPEQTYRRISLRRNVSCSSLYIIQVKRHRLHNVTRDDLVCFHCSNRTKVNDIAYGATTAKVMDWFC